MEAGGERRKRERQKRPHVVDRSQLTQVTEALRQLNVSTKTSSKKGSARLDELNKRLDDALAQAREEKQELEAQQITDEYYQLRRRVLLENETEKEKQEHSLEALLEEYDAALLRYDFIQICQYIRRGVDANRETMGGFTAILRAIYHRELAHIDRLVDLGADLDYVTINSGQSPLGLACACGDVETARHLVQRGADVDLELPDGNTALSIALKYGRIESLAAMLVEEGHADVDRRNKDGDSYLMRCAKQHFPLKLDCAKFLMRYGADVRLGEDPNDPHSGPIGVAWLQGEWTLAKYLEQEKFSRTISASWVVDRQHSFSDKFHSAKAQADHEMDHLVRSHSVKELANAVKAGKGRVDHETSEGETLMLWATHYGKVGEMLQLYRLGADVNYQNRFGDTPLLHAVKVSNVTSVCVLLWAFHADVHLRDQDGWTALMHAASRGSRILVQLLLAAHADLLDESDVGLTAQTILLASNREDLVQLAQAAQSSAGFIAHGMYYCADKQSAQQQFDLDLVHEHLQLVKETKAKLERISVQNASPPPPLSPKTESCRMCIQREGLARRVGRATHSAWAACVDCKMNFCHSCWKSYHARVACLGQHVPLLLCNLEKRADTDLDKLATNLAQRKQQLLCLHPQKEEVLHNEDHAKRDQHHFGHLQDRVQEFFQQSEEDQNQAKRASLHNRIDAHLQILSQAGISVPRLDEWHDLIQEDERSKFLFRLERQTENLLRWQWTFFTDILQGNPEGESVYAPPERVHVAPVQLELAAHLVVSSDLGKVQEALDLANHVLVFQNAAFPQPQNVLCIPTFVIISKAHLKLQRRQASADSALQVMKALQASPLAADSPVRMEFLQTVVHLLLETGHYERARRALQEYSIFLQETLGTKHAALSTCTQLLKLVSQARKEARREALARQRREKAAQCITLAQVSRTLTAFLALTADETHGWPLFCKFAKKQQGKHLTDFCNQVRKLNEAVGHDSLQCGECKGTLSRAELEARQESDQAPKEGSPCIFCEKGIFRSVFDVQVSVIYNRFIASTLFNFLPLSTKKAVKDALEHPTPDIFSPVSEAVIQHLHQHLYGAFLATEPGMLYVASYAMRQEPRLFVALQKIQAWTRGWQVRRSMPKR